MSMPPMFVKFQAGGLNPAVHEVRWLHVKEIIGLTVREDDASWNAITTENAKYSFADDPAELKQRIVTAARFWSNLLYPPPHTSKEPIT